MAGFSRATARSRRVFEAVERFEGDKLSKPEWFQRALAVPSQRATVMVEGTPIAYERWGDNGPGLVLVHGSNAHLEWWRFVAPFLADQFQVVALDSSGNGDSGWRDRYSGTVFAEEVRAVAEHAELGDRPFVVGHSFGGFVALEVGHRFGADLGGIVLVDFTVAPREAYHEWGLRATTEHKKPRRNRVYDDKATALGRFRLLPDQPNRFPAVLAHMAEYALKEVEGGWTWKFDPTLFDYLEMGADQHDKFVGLECPSAVILAEDSDDEGAFAAPHMAKITAGKLPLFHIPGTHHHLMFEEPLALAMSIKGILLAWVREAGRPEMDAALAAH